MPWRNRPRSKSQSANIYALQANRDVNEYFSRQAAAIQTEKHRIDAAAAAATASASSASSTSSSSSSSSPATSTAASSGASTHTPSAGSNPSGGAEPKMMNLDLVTRTTAVLSNEADVDTYLALLKKQLMEKINEGYQLTITK